MVKKAIIIEGEEYLPPKDAAKLLNVSTVTLDSWLKNGFIARYGISRRTKYYKKSEIITLLSKKEEYNVNKNEIRSK